jgi:UDP-glucose 4-epimerase
MAERVLVTGGAGFIGSHIVDTLIAEGYDVAIVDNLFTGKRANLNSAATFYEVDIRDTPALERVFAEVKPGAVCHQAALANVRGSLEHPDVYAEVNILGTLRLLEASRKHGVKKFTIASTGGAIYGDQAELPTREVNEAHPLDPYGVSKLACEHYLFEYRHNYGLDYCALRYGNVYGPRQDPHGEAGVVAIFTRRMIDGQPTTINGDGSQSRDFIYVGDVARANLLALQKGSGIYNIGTGKPTSINQIFQQLVKLTDYKHPELHGPQKPGEVRTSCIDPSRVKAELGWEATVSLADGLANTVAWYNESVIAATAK